MEQTIFISIFGLIYMAVSGEKARLTAISMMSMPHKRLVISILVLALFLAPLNSLAQELSAESCQSLASVCEIGHPEEPSGQSESSGSGDCCDTEKCSPEATEPPANCDLRTNRHEKQFFYPDPISRIPTVYLAIFVPPERRTLSCYFKPYLSGLPDVATSKYFE